MRTTSGKRSRTASACPPSPSVKSTCTAPGMSSAGVSSSRQRSSSTGTCVPRGSPMSTPFAHPAGHTSPVPARTSSVPPDPHPLVSPALFRRRPLPAGVASPFRSGHAPGAGEEAPGAGAAGDLAVRAVTSGAVSGGPAGWHALQSAGQHPLLDVGELVFARREVVIPGLLVPDLHAGARPDHHEVAVQGRVLPQVRRDGHPPLLVGHLVVSAGEEHPAVRPGGLVCHRRLPNLTRDPL